MFEVWEKQTSFIFADNLLTSYQINVYITKGIVVKTFDTVWLSVFMTWIIKHSCRIAPYAVSYLCKYLGFSVTDGGNHKQAIWTHEILLYLLTLGHFSVVSGSVLSWFINYRYLKVPFINTEIIQKLRSKSIIKRSPFVITNNLLLWWTYSDQFVFQIISKLVKTIRNLFCQNYLLIMPLFCQLVYLNRII